MAGSKDPAVLFGAHLQNLPTTIGSDRNSLQFSVTCQGLRLSWRKHRFSKAVWVFFKAAAVGPQLSSELMRKP
jgi:hypothetical protein